MSVFYRDIDAKIYLKEYKVELNKPLVVYQGDFNLEIYLRLLEYDTKFSKDSIDLLEDLNGAYANITLVNPLGYQIDVPDVLIENDKVKFIITKELTDELEEIGKYKMQIHIGNIEGDADTTLFSIPSFEFEVREKLAGIVINGLQDSEGYSLVDLDGYSLDNNSSKKIIGYPADQITAILTKANDTNLYTLTIGDTVAIAVRNYQYLEVSQNCTLTLPNISEYQNIELNIKMTGNYTITFPSEISWKVGTDFSKISDGVEFTVVLTYVNSWDSGKWKGGIIYYA